MKWVSWFLIATSLSYAADYKILIRLNQPTDVQAALSGLQILKLRQIGQMYHYKIVIRSNLSRSALLQEVQLRLQAASSEYDQSSSISTLDAAGLIDSRAIFVLDDIDSRAIFVLDQSQDPFEPLFGQEHTRFIYAEQAWPYTQGEGVVVAVLDTGADLTHPFLVDNLVQGYDFVDMDADPSEERAQLDSNQNGLIDEGWGHGTHVAGIVKTVAPRAGLMPIRVADSDGQAELSAIIQGIAFAVINGAWVINLSMSITETSPLLETWIDIANYYGVIIVTSAGNTNSTVLQHPARNPDVLTVTSVDYLYRKSSFANYSNKIDVSAPGEQIVSCLPGGGYVARSGTSMSAPMVAGEVAILLTLVPTASVDYIHYRVKYKSNNVNWYNPPVYQNKLGIGLIDVWDAITVQDQ